jgi:enolase-phosphatase E1
VGEPVRRNGVRAVVLDIEGTVGSIQFVHQVLFPYARQRYREWLDGLPGPDRAEVLAAVAAAAGAASLDVAGAVAALADWTDRDVKQPALKAAQARIWHAGFAAGQLRSDPYPDVAPALRAWKAQGLALFVYSSGAVAAQRDWFGNTTDGDLTGLLDGYFDLDSAGSKKDPASYTAIAGDIGVDPATIVFLTDAPAEVDAAAAAGWQAVRVDRDGGADAAGAIDSFARIFLSGDHARVAGHTTDVGTTHE